MQIKQSIWQLLRRLWHHITPRRRVQFGLLLVLMLLTSATEIVSIGAILPFLGILTLPEQFFESPSAQLLVKLLNLTDHTQLLLLLAVIFTVAILLAGVMRLILLWFSTRLSFATGKDLSVSIYRRTLYQSYEVHCSRNSGEIINDILSKANAVVCNIAMPVLTMMSSTLMLAIVIVTLLALNPVIAMSVFGGLGIIYGGIIYLTRKQLLIYGGRIASESNQIIKSLQEGFGGIRDVLIDGSQDTYCQIYQDADASLRRAQGNSMFISQSPRYVIEALGMMLFVTVAYSIAQKTGGVNNAIPMLGALALCAQRLLPVLQQAYISWASIRINQASLKDTLDLLDQPLPSYVSQLAIQQLPFNRSISLKQLDFCYNQQRPYVLKQINLTIAKGSRVGIIGTTGSGKSTLLDIVMALLQPTRGVLLIDDEIVTSENYRSWQANIAHVPQTIFLADSTIENNIAFGVPKDQIDHRRVREAAQQAQIAESIQKWPDKYQSKVGERGIRLSGGQRQRIGIARALYKQANVIIFDEATSALDNETEQEVMQAIESLSKDLTILIVAHRLTTIKNCTQIVELHEGVIKKIGNYEQVVNSKNK
jgi:ATP-binding cassette subfamily B protein